MPSFRRLRRAAFAAVLLALSPGPGAPSPARAAEERIEGPATPLAGDLLEVSGQRIRLKGIDAPDPGQTCRTRGGRVYDCAQEALTMLGLLVEDRSVSCDAEPPGRDGRRVGTCRIDGISVGGAMVLRGWAFAAERLAPDYVPLQSHAQARRAGMWGGRVEAPWLWRSRRLRETGTPPGPG
jgi:endonuclease YncB( thermonuclease family)